jgi:hypothetical protein
MSCGSFGVTPVLVGRHRIGLVGLPDALKKVDSSGLAERGEVVDLLLETLKGDNYVRDSQMEDFRTAVWREYLKHKGRDASAFYSEIEVVVRGEEGAALERFLSELAAVFGGFDLRPLVTREPASPEGPNPQLVIEDETILRGLPPNRWSFESAVRKSFSDW